MIKKECKVKFTFVFPIMQISIPRYLPKYHGTSKAMGSFGRRMRMGHILIWSRYGQTISSKLNMFEILSIKILSVAPISKIRVASPCTLVQVKRHGKFLSTFFNPFFSLHHCVRLDYVTAIRCKVLWPITTDLLILPLHISLLSLSKHPSLCFPTI